MGIRGVPTAWMGRFDRALTGSPPRSPVLFQTWWHFTPPRKRRGFRGRHLWGRFQPARTPTPHLWLPDTCGGFCPIAAQFLVHEATEGVSYRAA